MIWNTFVKYQSCSGYSVWDCCGFHGLDSPVSWEFLAERKKESKVGLGKGVQLLLKLSNFQGLENSLSNFNVRKHYLGNLLKISMTRFHLERVWGRTSMGVGL